MKNNLFRCPQCKVSLFQSSQFCPLCGCVTEEPGPDEKESIRKLFGEAAPYPNIHQRQRLLRFILKLVLFIFVLSEAVMVLVNVLTPISYPWSLLTGLTLLYIYLFLVYWVSRDTGFAAKVGLQLMITMFFLLGIDFLNGMHGWSLEWAIPGIILLGDGIVFFLMMLNRSRWQSYLLLLLLMGACSLCIILLYLKGIINGIIMPLICAGVTLLFIFGTVLFGGRSAGREISRRIHL